MISLILETFRPYVLIALFMTQMACILFGSLMLLIAIAIHSGLGAAESLVFLVPGILLTALRRIVARVRL